MSGLYNWVTSAATPTDNAATPTEPEDSAATPSPPPQEAQIRSACSCVLNKNSIQIPAQEARRVSPQERLRICTGRSTPTPSPTASTQFDFPTATMAPTHPHPDPGVEIGIPLIPVPVLEPSKTLEKRKFHFVHKIGLFRFMTFRFTNG